MKCKECPLGPDSINGPLEGRWVGPQDGSPVMMVVGDAPTLMDDRKHKVFTGQRGHLIDDTIRTSVPKARIFYTNILRCRVADSSELNDKVVAGCFNTDEFSKLVNEVNPSVIVTLGNIPLKAVTGKSGITKYRGSELNFQDYLVVPTYSPGAVFRTPKYETPFKSDITKAAIMASGGSQKLAYHYVPLTTKAALVDAIRTLKIQKAHGKIPYVTLDFETATYDYWRPETHILCMGFCADGYNMYSIPIDHAKSPWRGQAHKIASLFKFLFCDPNIPVENNNWKYDQKWARAKMGMTVNFGPDNMLISYANDENAPHGLKYQADTYFSSGQYDKEVIWPKEFDPVKDDIVRKVKEYDSMDLVKLMKYNAFDALYSWHIYPVEKERLHNDVRVERIYQHLLEPGSHLFVRIEEQGMWVDPDRLRTAKSECQLQINKSLSTLNALIPEGWCERNLGTKQLKEGFNWNSTKQLGQLFFQKDGFNFPILMKTKTGAASTSESVIISLSAQIDHPALNGLLEYRKWAKYMSTYLSPWSCKVDKNSRLHPNFKLHGTVTGRLSGEDGVHQVPRDNFIRRIIGAPPGWSFLEIDGSQIELRVVAAIAHEHTMLRIYATGGDIHRTTGATVTGKRVEEVTSTERKKAKAVNFGFVYGMGWRKFKIYAWEKYGVRLTDEEAKQYRERFFDLYHELPDWHQRTKSLVRKLGYVVSPIGRKRRLPNIFSSDEGIKASAEREAINSPVQGFGSDYVLAAFIDMYFKYILPQDPYFETIRPVGSVHDAQYYEIRNDKIAYWAPIIKKNFDDASRLKEWFDYTPPLLIPGDMKIGNHWGDAKDWDLGQPYPHEMR